MTDENRKENSTAELDRARQCLEEARVLAAALFPFGAASRAYYALFHAARALLVSKGIEARSHRAVVGLLGEHFVKKGSLSAELARRLSRMQRDREDADYEPGAVFTEGQAREAILHAEGFLTEVERLLGGGVG